MKTEVMAIGEGRGIAGLMISLECGWHQPCLLDISGLACGAVFVVIGASKI